MSSKVRVTRKKGNVQQSILYSSPLRFFPNRTSTRTFYHPETQIIFNQESSPSPFRPEGMGDAEVHIKICEEDMYFSMPEHNFGLSEHRRPFWENGPFRKFAPNPALPSSFPDVYIERKNIHYQRCVECS
jgi:hypothetical protein